MEFKINATRISDNANVVIEVESDAWMNGDCPIHDEDAMYSVFVDNADGSIEDVSYVCKRCIHVDFIEK